MGLLLQAVDAAGPWTWRWLLTEEDTGQPLADHQVDLDPASDEVAAFGDLYGYARSHAAPDRRTASETGITERAGAWAGRVGRRSRRRRRLRCGCRPRRRRTSPCGGP